MSQRLASNVDDFELKILEHFIAETREVAAMLQGLIRSIEARSALKTEN